jgi:metallophosphoesterase superfamily enzyme
VAAFDCHFGFDKVYKRGRLQTVPAYNVKAINAMMSFIKDYQPDVVVAGGDFINASAISHWNKSRHQYKEGMRLKDDLDLCVKYWLDPIADLLPSRTRRIWIPGNHDRWVDDFLLEHPEIEGLVSIADYLNLKGRGWEVYDYGEMANVGKVWFMHGENTTGRYHATTTVQQYHRNIRYGHHHTYQVATEVSPVDCKDFHTAISVPCLSSRNPGYASNRPDRHVNGFLAGESLKSGAFRDEVVVMVNDQFVMGGRVYSG